MMLMLYVGNDSMVKPVYRGQSNLYIKGTRRNLKMCPLSAVGLFIQFKIICTICLIEKMRLPLICYIEVLFKMRLPLICYIEVL
jgi:hypothetical protein